VSLTPPAARAGRRSIVIGTIDVDAPGRQAKFAQLKFRASGTLTVAAGTPRFTGIAPA
jgi:hypothetical protein